MAPELCLSHQYRIIDVFTISSTGFNNCLNHSQLSGVQDSNLQSSRIVKILNCSPDSTGHLFIFLFFFQPAFFLWTKLGLFLYFPSAFILFSFITHICFSLHENDLRRTVVPNVCRQAASAFFADFLSYRFQISFYY